MSAIRLNNTISSCREKMATVRVYQDKNQE